MNPTSKSLQNVDMYLFMLKLDQNLLEVTEVFVLDNALILHTLNILLGSPGQKETQLWKALNSKNL